MSNREKFEEYMRVYDPDQSLTLAAEYPHYASYVTCMAAHMFESRQPEIDVLKAETEQLQRELVKKDEAIDMYKRQCFRSTHERNELGEEVAQLRKSLDEFVSYLDGDKEPDFPHFIALIENLRAALERSK